MLKMFQRQIAASQSGLARQGSSELAASPVSRGVSRNNSFSRRAPAGQSGIPHSRSRTSLLVACSTSSAFNGDGSANDANSAFERQSFSQGDPKAQPHSQPQLPSTRPGAGDSIRPSDAHLSSPLSASTGSPTSPQKPEQSWDFGTEPFVPSPSNLPTNEEDEPLLYPPRPPLWTWTSQPGVDLFRAGPRIWSRLRQVFVILFGVGERETEGIYSLRAFSTDGTPHETIIAFECEEEAQRYACLLEASMDHKPHVCSIPPLELVSFCLDQTYSCRLEPKGSLLIPPDFNVAVTDWERSLRLRDGKFAVLEAEPDCSRGLGGGGAAAATATATAAPPAAAGPAARPGGGQPPSHHGGPPQQPGGGGIGNLQEVGGGTDPSTLARYSGLSADELEQIRARLEALLPKS